MSNNQGHMQEGPMMITSMYFLQFPAAKRLFNKIEYIWKLISAPDATIL